MYKRINICIYAFAVIGIVLMLSSGCKEDEDPAPQVPEFTITADSVLLQSGGQGLQFFAKCTNEDIKMTEVTVISPITVQTATYSLNGNSFAMNDTFSLQDDDIAYGKELGTWNFTFVGNRTSDDVSFSVAATLSITVK
jgi:hypothetical protein